MLSTRRRAQKVRTRNLTDLSARRRGRPTFFRPSTPNSQTSAASPTPRRSPLPSRTQSVVDPGTHGTSFFNERTESEWMLRGRGFDRRLVQLAVKDATKEPVQQLQKPPRSVSSDVDELLQPRRRRSRNPSAPVDLRMREARVYYGSRRGVPRADRRVQYTRSKRRDLGSDDAHELEKHAWYDPEVDYNWRLPVSKPPRRPRALMEDGERETAEGITRVSNGTGSESDVRTVRPNVFPMDRTDRRAMPRDRSGKRIGNGGARWRGLMARKDLVDGKADAFSFDGFEKQQDLSPRSSLDIEEAASYTSWDDPPSTSVRGWRSNNSLSYRPVPETKPRNIKDIGRQRCINDLTNIVDASNEACVSYDRQIFDPVSKLWTYVGKSQPSSSPWELRAVGSPITCSVSGTEEAVSSNGPGTVPASRVGLIDVVAPAPAPPPDAPSSPKETKRRNSSPSFAAVTTTRKASIAFKATRDFWLGGNRNSVYGPANLNALVMASEMDDQDDLIRHIDDELEDESIQRSTSLT